MQVTVWQRGRSYNAHAADGETLLAVLRRIDSYFSAPCGGNRQCGKCLVRFTMGATPPSEKDLQKLAPEQIADGWRLACTATLHEDCIVVIPTLEQSIRVNITEVAPRHSDGTLGIAIDFGTTTLAAALVELMSGDPIAVHTAVNRQRSFGADVLSRIQAAGSGHAEALRAMACADVNDLVTALLQKTNTAPGQVKRVAIAANTTMQHLLCGLDTTGLGAAPFTPVTCSPKTTPYPELTGHDTLDCPVTFVPGASAFIGGDVVAGLVACDFEQHSCLRLFMDIGTNGELVLADGDRYIATSVAAGPAFEGGRLSCGVSSVPGAICYVYIISNSLTLYDTIGDKPPIGLCGTGAIAALRALRRAGIVDKTGRLSPLFPEGYPITEGAVLTQDDIRELQMAKAAVSAGITLLMRKAGRQPDATALAFLAGGFGAQLDVNCAQEIGMLPRGLAAVAAGNTALDGAICCLQQEAALARAAALAAKIEDFTLADDPAFEETYMQAMEL